jgi:hypothetical protein
VHYLEVKVNTYVFGSHILVNFPQSVLPCMLAGEIGIFCKNSIRDG